MAVSIQNQRLATFAALPSELIALIATFSDARSWLGLIQTSKFIRASVYNVHIIQQILLAEHHVRWQSKAPSDWTTTAWLDRLASRAGNDKQLWVRYALAADQLNRLKKPHSEHNPECKDWQNWLPELLLLRPPELSNLYGLMGIIGPIIQESDELNFVHLLQKLFQVAHTPSDRPQPILDCSARLMLPNQKCSDERYFRLFSASPTATFTVLMYMSDNLKRRHQTRRAVWPYMQYAMVPEAELPLLSNMRLNEPAAYSTNCQLPVPYSRACGLSATQSWMSWYSSTCTCLLSSPNFLFDGEWQGYYTYHRSANDPPMVDIVFTRTPIGTNNVSTAAAERSRTHISARNCRDGYGGFSLTGYAEKRSTEHGIVLVMEKIYDNGTRWRWHCSLTPFGIVGLWAHPNNSPNDVHNGGVWLWKREWCE